MDNLRIMLWVGLGLMVWLTIQAWQNDYAPAPAQADAQPAGPVDVLESPDLPDALESDLPALPESAPLVVAPAQAQPEPAAREMIRVRTDVLDIRIDPVGGDIHSTRLLDYPVHKDAPDIPVTLLKPDPPGQFVFRTGIRVAEAADEPTHRAKFSAEQAEYRLGEDSDKLTVRLTWAGAGGLTATKIYTFGRGRYDIGFEQQLENDGETVRRAVSYLQLQRAHDPLERSMFNVDSYSYMGPVSYDGEKYEKLDPEDLAEEPYTNTLAGGWVASIQHHFLAALVPDAERIMNYSGTFDGERYLLSIIGEEFTTVAPGATATFAGKMFIGPKLQSQLEETADGLVLTVDYGVLTLLAQPLFWVLQKIHNFVGNWGWSIIIVTFLIKLAFYKLTEASGRSMAKMRKLQPRLKALQDRYKDDREKMSKALMDLYKREKVNPAAGCLPMLIQIPFFIAFYWVLLESVEMRQAPFLLWITDLSTRDPYFVLPLLMGAAMFFQQKLNPAPPDPMQAKIMQFLPLIFTVFFAFFPAGLVLYWLTNSVLSMLQQWRINKVLGAD